MSTIFHEGRKVLRQEIGNANYAEIADFLYFRENVSQYTDKDKNKFFLLPNVDYISQEVGFGKTLVSKALSKLEEKALIKKVKHKCYDGAVRIKIYITDKFKSVMHKIALLKSSNNVNAGIPSNDIKTDDSDSPQNAISDSPQKRKSIIKEEDNKRKNNNMLKEPVSLDLISDKIQAISGKENLDPTELYLNAMAIQELNLIDDTDTLLDTAIGLTKHNTNERKIVETGIHFSKLYEKVEFDRGEQLTPCQRLYLSSLLNYVATYTEFDKAEVYAWMEFQLTNPEHHYHGRDFRHACNIIKKALLSGSVKGYCKPKGLKMAA